MSILQSSELKYCQIQPQNQKNQPGVPGVVYKNRQFVKLESYRLNQLTLARKSCQQLLDKNETVIIVKEASAYSLWSLSKPLSPGKNLIFENLQVDSTSLPKVKKNLSRLSADKKKSKWEIFLSTSSLLLFLV